MMRRAKEMQFPMGWLFAVGLVLCHVFVICCSEASAQSHSTAASPSRKASATILSFETPMADKQFFAHVLFDQLEGRTGANNPNFRWDGEGWIGGDLNRWWFKSEGFANSGSITDGVHEALYDHPIPRLRYFDGQIGVRADLDSGPHRLWAAVGMEGLAPWFFDFAPTFYIRENGHVAGRIVGSYDLLLTQRLVVQPEAELNFYSKDDPARRIGSGLSDLDTGLRLRYEFSRKFAPYVGWAYHGEYGNSALYARQAHETTRDSQFVFGLRVWY
jgi:copper resistance protein B